jgi:hypothetical protein
MKYAVLALALLAATAAQADSLTDPGCFTPQAGFSFITSLPICPATPVVTPPVTQPGEDMDETSDDQGGNNQGEINTTETVSSVPDQGGHFIFENGRLVFAAPAEPVGVPEPSSAWLLVLGLGTVVLAGRKVVYSR